MTTTEEKILDQLRPAVIAIVKTFGNQIDLGNDFIRFRYLDETYELKVRKVKPRKQKPNETD